MSWIEVIDDGVKIGLGALIGGFFACWIAYHNSKSAIQKLQFERRSKTLSEAAQIFESLFQAFVKYSNSLSGLAEATASRPSDSLRQPTYDEFLTDRATDTLKLRIQTAERIEQSLTAQSQLMLLGERKCRETADALFTAIRTADEAFKFDGKSFTRTQWDAVAHFCAAVRDARAAFYQEMEKAFRKASQ